MIEPRSEVQQRWVDAVFATLRTEDKVAQLLMPTLGAYDYHREAVNAFLAERTLGGIFVGMADGDRHREEITQLQARCSIPLVVASDLEAGASHFVRGGVPFPEPLAVAAANDTQLAYTLGTAAAREGRYTGIHWTFAPVVDVNVNPDNPIANTRSFGADPERLARLAEAVMRGLQEHGLAACAKHFPGDGVDDVDQHTVTSVHTLSRQEWHRISGLPFRRAIAAGVWSTMVGHITLPAWDDSQHAGGAYRPASISPTPLTGLLRGELGFQGLIVTDGMNMGGGWLCEASGKNRDLHDRRLRYIAVSQATGRLCHAAGGSAFGGFARSASRRGRMPHFSLEGRCEPAYRSPLWPRGHDTGTAGLCHCSTRCRTT
jgi:beta-N-acetylhexosaminidase